MDLFEEDKDKISATTSFSQLLFSDDHVGGGGGGGQGFYFSNSTKPPKMLCFGGLYNTDVEDEVLKSDIMKSVVTCTATATDSSSSSSPCSVNNKKSVTPPTPKSTSNPNGSVQDPVRGSSTTQQKRGGKRAKTETRTTTGIPKGRRKEKLGERIAALQQLVSPFGKTDTASVLHEAMGYINFLHQQVQILSYPYLHKLPPPVVALDGGVEEEKSNTSTNENEKDNLSLTSKGLCLVPLAFTVRVARSNGADFWSPLSLENQFISPV